MTSLRKKLILAGCCFAFVLTADLAAQFSGFDFSTGSKRGKDTPTNVSAESMDIDINRNQVTLIGNVNVDDQSMNIRCRKMILYFVDKEASGAKKQQTEPVKKEEKKAVTVKKAEDGKGEKGEKGKKGEKRKKEAEKNETDRKIDRIECIGDVEITRVTGEGKDRQYQKAFAKKAVYRMQDNMIALTGDPIVVSGKNQLKGEFITIDTKSGRISVLRPDSRIIGGFKGLSPEKEDSGEKDGKRKN